MSFDSFELDPALLAGVRDMGFIEPTDIQRDAIPWGLEGRDLLACAMTGSGKTAAFALPILQRLLQPAAAAPPAPSSCRRPASWRCRSSSTSTRWRRTRRVQIASIYGGVGYEPQERAFREGVDVLIATPGRLLDLLSSVRTPTSTVSRCWCSTRPTACSTWASSPTCGAS